MTINVFENACNDFVIQHLVGTKRRVRTGILNAILEKLIDISIRLFLILLRSV